MTNLGARYGHTNVIARDWRRLATFYETVFGCVMVPPERDVKGEQAERGTAVAGAQFRGVHLRLPGHGPDGPTLEIYTYEANVDPDAAPAANRVGWGHIAFMVEASTNPKPLLVPRGVIPVRQEHHHLTGRGAQL